MATNTPATIEPHQTNDQEREQAKATMQSAGVDAIQNEVEIIRAAAQVVPVLIDGGMAPERYLPGYKTNKMREPQTRDQAIAAGMAAAVFGAGLGMGVAKSLQNVFTVHGQPSIYARTATAVVMSLGHEVWEEETSANRVTVCARRKGETRVRRSTWTIDKAAKAGFTGNSKYKSQPEEMLYAKAAMTVCRRAFPDVMEGMPYSVEERELDPDFARSDNERRVTNQATRLDKPDTAQQRTDSTAADLAALTQGAPSSDLGLGDTLAGDNAEAQPATAPQPQQQPQAQQAQPQPQGREYPWPPKLDTGDDAEDERLYAIIENEIKPAPNRAKLEKLHSEHSGTFTDRHLETFNAALNARSEDIANGQESPRD